MGITVITEIDHEGRKRRFQIPKWQIFVPLTIFCVIVIVVGVVVGTVIVPNAEKSRKLSECNFQCFSNQGDCWFKCGFNDTCESNCKNIESICKQKCSELYH